MRSRPEAEIALHQREPDEASLAIGSETALSEQLQGSAQEPAVRRARCSPSSLIGLSSAPAAARRSASSAPCAVAAGMRHRMRRDLGIDVGARGLGHAVVRRQRAVMVARRQAAAGQPEAGAWCSRDRCARRRRTSGAPTAGSPGALGGHRRARACGASSPGTAATTAEARARAAGRSRARAASAAVPAGAPLPRVLGLDLGDQRLGASPSRRRRSAPRARRRSTSTVRSGAAAQQRDELCGIGGGERRQEAGRRVVGVHTQRRQQPPVGLARGRPGSRR